MKIDQFAALVTDGITPVVEFNKGIEDIESYAEAGMRARVIGVSHSPDFIKLKVDFSEFEPFNQRFEQPNYYDKQGNPTLTAHQAGFYTATDSYSFEPQDITKSYFEVVEDTSLKLYDRYKTSSQSTSYVQWLEHFVARQIGI